MKPKKRELLLIPYFAAVSARAVCRALALRHPEAEIPALISLPVQRVGDPAARSLFQNHMTAWSLMTSLYDDLGLPPEWRDRALPSSS